MPSIRLRDTTTPTRRRWGMWRELVGEGARALTSMCLRDMLFLQEDGGGEKPS